MHISRLSLYVYLASSASNALFSPLSLTPQVEMDTRPPALGVPSTGHFSVMVDTPQGLAPLTSPAQVVARGRKRCTIGLLHYL